MSPVNDVTGGGAAYEKAVKYSADWLAVSGFNEAATAELPTSPTAGQERTMPIEPELQDTELRQRIAGHLDARRLPLILPNQIAAAYGKGQRCAVCGSLVTRAQVEYEVQGFGRALSMHFECHVLWQLECQARIKAQRRAV
jgi:hypothetical protein